MDSKAVPFASSSPAVCLELYVPSIMSEPGIPTSEGGYTSATAGGETIKSERTCGGMGGRNNNSNVRAKNTNISASVTPHWGEGLLAVLSKN